MRGHVAAEEAGIRFVPGARVRLLDGFEYLAWPKDRAAYGRLARLLSRGRMEAPKGECRIDRDDLIAHAEGLALALLPPDALDESFAARLRRDADALRECRPALPLFCAVQHRFRGDDRRRLDRLAAMAGAARAPLLAAGGVRYHHPDRRRLADVLTAIRLGATIDTLGHAAEANAEAHLKPGGEMSRLFEGHEEAVANVMRVVAACSFSMKDLSYEYPDEILDGASTPQEMLKRCVARAMTQRWPSGVPKGVRAQIWHELRLIERLDYASYFLTVHKIVRFAAGKKILCQGRGSAANSVVCYALGITSVPPEKFDLLFERFMSAPRNEPPDVDVDFEHERREEVIQHIYERYGHDHAALAATVIRYRERSAIREVGKAVGLSEDVTGRLAKAVWGAGARSLREVAAGEGLDPEGDRRLGMACDLAEELIEFPRHLATHVGGFVITRGPLTELAVVTKAAMENRRTIEWDKDDIEALCILKVDVLGLGMLSCVRRAFDLIAQHGGKTYTLARVPQDCERTYEMLSRADSLGVFQVESRAQMNMLPRLRPKTFYDLVIEVAIVRPGPIQGDMVRPYLRQRESGKEPTFPKEELRGVLSKMLGVPLFQEQAMQIAITAAGFSPEDADRLRRAMATFRNDGKVAEFEARFVEGMVQNGYARDFTERRFRQIKGFGSYGFPESHAVAFAQLVYVSAWIKCHHPAVFAAALLNSQPMGFYAPAQIVRDAREHGVRVRPVDVLRSDWDCGLETDPTSANGLALRLGLRMVQGLSEPVAGRIVQAPPRRARPRRGGAAGGGGRLPRPRPGPPRRAVGGRRSRAPLPHAHGRAGGARGGAAPRHGGRGDGVGLRGHRPDAPPPPPAPAAAAAGGARPRRHASADGRAARRPAAAAGHGAGAPAPRQREGRGVLHRRGRVGRGQPRGLPGPGAALPCRGGRGAARRRGGAGGAARDRDGTDRAPDRAPPAGPLAPAGGAGLGRGSGAGALAPGAGPRRRGGAAGPARRPAAGPLPGQPRLPLALLVPIAARPRRADAEAGPAALSRARLGAPGMAVRAGRRGTPATPSGAGPSGPGVGDPVTRPAPRIPAPPAPRWSGFRSTALAATAPGRCSCEHLHAPDRVRSGAICSNPSPA